MLGDLGDSLGELINPYSGTTLLLVGGFVLALAAAFTTKVWFVHHFWPSH
ncbi:MAG: hypothetical protein IT462_04985 [Planctomycetes bacterium]|nr:hypothetical protein [Planctomycetota bacterium]